MKSGVVESLAIGLLCLSAASPSFADAAKEAACATYAKRAVEEYDILTRHSKCQADNNLRWQSNYDNHYKGCLALPAFMTKAEEKTRDQQLHACGALNPDGSEAAADRGAISPASSAANTAAPASAPAPAPAAAPAGAAVSAPAAAAAQASAPGAAPTGGASTPQPPAPAATTSAAATGGDPCQRRDPPYGASDLAHVEPGYGWKVGNGTLSYLDINTHQMRSYQVLRPVYFLNFIKCARAALPPTGAYVSSNGMLFLLNDQGSVLAYQVRGDVLAKLLDGAQPSTDSADGPGSADPGKAVLQVGGTITPPTGNNGVPCSAAQPPSFSLRGGTFGIGGKIAGSTLTYQDMKEPHQSHTYAVQRPGYYVAATSCMQQTSNSGPWLSLNPAMFFIVYDNGNVTASPVDAATMPKLLAVPH